MEQLPVEVLCLIFKQLTQKQLIAVSTVSKHFNQIIESNRLVLGVKVDSRTDSSLQPPKRKFIRAFVRDSNATNFTKALHATADYVEEVTIEHHATTLSSIVAVLNLLPKVRKITFRYLRLEDDDESVCAAVVQPLNDIVLEFYETSPTIFKVLHQVSCQSITVRYYGDTPYYDFTDMLPFMRVQKSLWSFAIGGIFESNLMYGCIPKGDYHLSEFSICNSDLEEYSYLETFLADHVSTLEKLSIRDVHGWDPSSVIKQCTRLKSLALEKITLNEIAEEMASVEELSFTLPNPSMSKFPNVKKLYMEKATVESNRLLSASMRKVEELTIRYGSANGCHFENATKMALINTDAIDNEFFTLHTKVEELLLKNFFPLNDDLLEVIVSRLKHLRVLRIHSVCGLTARAFQIIREHCRNLRVLDMKTWSQPFSIENWKCLHDIAGIRIYTEKFD